MIQLAPLPFAFDALAPHISEEALRMHYEHQEEYVRKINDLLAGTPHERKSVEELIRDRVVYNDACQVWNHDFSWNSMSPRGGGRPRGALGELIRLSFGGFSRFQKKFNYVAAGTFGPGWTWLVRRVDGNLDVMRTDAASIFDAGRFTPVLVCDVWEHAYYLDYRNARKEYVAAWWELVDWSFAEANLVGRFGAVMTI